MSAMQKQQVWKQIKRDVPSFADFLSENKETSKAIGEFVENFGLIKVVSFSRR